MRKILLIIFIVYASLSLAQNNLETNCTSDLSFLTEKIRQNYAGFQDKMHHREAELQSLTDSLNSVAKQARNSAQCTELLKKWTNFFDDAHLWLSSQSKVKQQSSASESAKNNLNPSLKFRDKQTAYMRIPSFALNYKSHVDSLLDANRNKLANTPNFILDIRDNGGGSDPAFNKLLPLLYTDSFTLKGVEVRVTEDNIEHFASLIEREDIPESARETLRGYLDRMRGNEGAFVTLAKDRVVRKDTTYRYPKRVAVLVNGGVLSSAEQFLLHARQSDKTILFGEPTGGAIDYANLNIMELPSGDRLVGIPTTRSRRLPENPIDPNGIAPDVLIPKDVENWITFTRDYLSNNKYFEEDSNNP